MPFKTVAEDDKKTALFSIIGYAINMLMTEISSKKSKIPAINGNKAI
ncbi:hypothetical protein [Sphingobacterium thalpophilum]|nr:hypothetical protein [Sphingobacterium thalpophilum]